MEKQTQRPSTAGILDMTGKYLNDFLSILRQALNEILSGVFSAASSLVNLFLGNRQASAQLRFGLLFTSILFLWGLSSYVLRARMAAWRSVITFFQSFLAPEVLSIMLVAIVPIVITLRLAAIYLDDIFELQNVGVATRYILQAAFALRYQIIRIVNGGVHPEDVNAPAVRIGGPGNLRVYLENAAVFERLDGRARVLPGDTQVNKTGNGRRISYLKAVVWVLSFILSGFMVNMFFENGTLGIAAWIVINIWGGFSAWLLSNVFSVLLGGLCAGIAANIVGRLAGGAAGAVFGGLLVSVFGGAAALLVGGVEGWGIGLAAGVILILWQGGQGGMVPIEGFERLRAVIDVRPQKLTLKPITARTRDGIQIRLDDVQAVFHVYRPEPKTHSFDAESLTRLVYEESPLPWQVNVENRISTAVRTMVGQKALFDILTISQAFFPEQGNPFVLRETAGAELLENFNKDAEKRGVSLQWIGLGTWKPVRASINEILAEFWNTSSQQRAEETLETVRQRTQAVKLQEYRRMFNLPVEIVKRHQEREKNLPPFGSAPGTVGATVNTDGDQLKIELLSAFRDRFIQARREYIQLGEVPPDYLEAALMHINDLLSYRP